MVRACLGGEIDHLEREIEVVTETGAECAALRATLAATEETVAGLRAALAEAQEEAVGMARALAVARKAQRQAQLAGAPKPG